jgi:hypothetical protein
VIPTCSFMMPTPITRIMTTSEHLVSETLPRLGSRMLLLRLIVFERLRTPSFLAQSSPLPTCMVVSVVAFRTTSLYPLGVIRLAIGHWRLIDRYRIQWYGKVFTLLNHIPRFSPNPSRNHSLNHEPDLLILLWISIRFPTLVFKRLLDQLFMSHTRLSTGTTTP